MSAPGATDEHDEAEVPTVAELVCAMLMSADGSLNDADGRYARATGLAAESALAPVRCTRIL